MVTPYHFRTDWDFNAPRRRVWDTIRDFERFPSLWRDFRRVELVRGDGRTLGSIYRCEVRGSLPYTLRYLAEVTAVEELQSITLESSGDLVGTGRWELSDRAPMQTRATYFWDVGTTNPVLNLIAPLAKSLLARNHDQVMARGFTALRPVIESRAGVSD